MTDCFWTNYVNVQEDCVPSVSYSLQYNEVNFVDSGDSYTADVRVKEDEGGTGEYTGDTFLDLPVVFTDPVFIIGSGTFQTIQQATVVLAIQEDLPLGVPAVWSVVVLGVNPDATAPAAATIAVDVSSDTKTASFTFFDDVDFWSDILTHQGGEGGETNCNGQAFITVEFRVSVGGNIVATAHMQLRSFIACF
jgi:hypothetical protein